MPAHAWPVPCLTGLCSLPGSTGPLLSSWPGVRPHYWAASRVCESRYEDDRRCWQHVQMRPRSCHRDERDARPTIPLAEAGRNPEQHIEAGSVQSLLMISGAVRRRSRHGDA